MWIDEFNSVSDFQGERSPHERIHDGICVTFGICIKARALINATFACRSECELSLTRYALISSIVIWYEEMALRESDPSRLLESGAQLQVNTNTPESERRVPQLPSGGEQQLAEELRTTYCEGTDEHPAIGKTNINPRTECLCKKPDYRITLINKKC